MKLENGKVILEKRRCIMCSGSGKIEPHVLCPNYNKAMYGKNCEFCGSTRKTRHGYIKTGKVSECVICDGSGERPEEINDYAPKEMWRSLNFEVVRSSRDQTAGELLLGVIIDEKGTRIPTVYSVTDYGRHTKLSDEELVKNCRDSSTSQQLSSFAREEKDGIVLCDKILILCNRNGYTLVPILKS